MLKINCKGKTTVRKQTKEYRKTNNRFKKLKLKKREREKKKRKTPQNCKSPTQRQRFITTVKTEGKKKAQ